MKNDLSIVLCTYNEEKHVQKTILKILSVFPEAEIVIVDDNSSDQTISIIKKLDLKNIKLIVRKKVRGLASAFLVGMFNASRKYIGWIDTNMDYVIDEFKQAEKILNNNTYDLVLLSRYVEGGKDDRVFIRVFFSKVLNFICRNFFNSKIKDFSSGIFLMNKKILKEVVPLGYGYGEFFIEFIVRISDCKFRIIEIPFTQHADLPDNNSKTSPNLYQFLRLSVIYFLRIFTMWFRK
ncbi:glycosyltransferase [Pelagibacteraceae bacterium]|nr:glycosyltransferase [Pelagibacteraceae bacterium]